jgi:hypothetical protein
MRLMVILLSALVVLTRVSGDEPSEHLKVARGQMTFDSEGNEGGTWHSRKPHVPSESSGLTIGRGYDMKFRTKEQVEKQLLAAGLNKTDAVLYAGGAKLSGKTAKEYIAKSALPEITLEQQKKLFEITYAEIEEYAKQLCTSKEVEAQYGACDWEKLHPAIRELIIDLRYRGDYTPTTRKKVQPLVVTNDLPGLAKLMTDRDFWEPVPSDRFNRRAAFMKLAVEKSK